MAKRPSLHVRFDARIVLGGPKHLEASARAQLAQVLYQGYSDAYPGDESFDGLSACYYLDHSGMAAVWSERIANAVPYVVRGRRIVIGVPALDVVYQNKGAPAKWWARVRNGRATQDPGDLV